jgi:hypothetical protein
MQHASLQVKGTTRGGSTGNLQPVLLGTPVSS